MGRAKRNPSFYGVSSYIYVSYYEIITSQLKESRLVLDLKQKDMLLRIGVSRQQYQQLESKGNPRLNTLELIAKGLNSELMLIPTEKLSMVEALLKSGEFSSSPLKNKEDKLVGYIAGFQNGGNVLIFTDEFKDDPTRPTFSLIAHPKNSKPIGSSFKLTFG